MRERTRSRGTPDLKGKGFHRAARCLGGSFYGSASSDGPWEPRGADKRLYGGNSKGGRGGARRGGGDNPCRRGRRGVGWRTALKKEAPMRTLPLAIALALCLDLGAGGALAAPVPAGPLCDSTGACFGATNVNIHQKGWRLKTTARQPKRYACDTFGWHCRYTRAYFISDDGNARWDPSLEREQAEE